MKCFARGPSASGSDDSYVQPRSRPPPRHNTVHARGPPGKIQEGGRCAASQMALAGPGQAMLWGDRTKLPSEPFVWQPRHARDRLPAWAPVTVTSPKQRINVLL